MSKMKNKKCKKLFFKALRTQLPLSYAGIAFITTTLIGAVSLFVIWNYYHGLEKEYLNSNLRGTVNSVVSIVEENQINEPDILTQYGDVFQNQTKITAFLIQSRMRILDADRNVIADSGSPSESWNITFPKPKATYDKQPVDSSVPSEFASSDPQSFSLQRSEDTAPQNNGGKAPPYSIQANPALFGFLLQDTLNEDGKRSSIVLEEPFNSTDGTILGYIELSESPAYGQRILMNVLKGWGIASLVGLVVSMTFGWIMSRKLTKPLTQLEIVANEMKNGNYEIRSPVFAPQELASLSGTFNQMAEHIQNSIETLRQFVSDAAHEIRTPLTSLRADLNLALVEKTMKPAKLMVQRSLEQVERLDQLTHDLLDLSKLESNNDQIRSEPVELGGLLAEISEVHASAAEQAGMQFEVSLPAEELWVVGDKSQLTRAVGNLLDNAVKFTPSAGYVKLALSRDDKIANIEVEDNGIGIPPDEQSQLFSRFHRGKNTQRFPGSGLGLAIAKTIIDKYHGEIGLRQDAERKVFFVKLPLING